MSAHTLRIALLHLAPIPSDLARNRRLVEKAVTAAARLGATWIITPELVVTGYTFADSIGTRWILPQPDSWMTHMSRLAAQLRVTLFLSCPEQDRKFRKFYNSLFAIAADGSIVGTHRKIHTLRVGSEAWSTPGTQAIAIPILPFTQVGMLICADAFTSEIARNLQAQGAQLLVSSAAWAPGLHGPNGEWERCTSDTGLPLLVCNRTGPDRTLDFRQAESVVVKDGKRLLSLSSARSAIFTIDWDLETQTLATMDYKTVYL
ncbi:MAG TPA: carbon-nitrogen hydrolase family protein [Nitrospiraceae bacterium]|nr:carbon-nitrogen hydrolase family protein [Nitrospiraceae bacterium]